MTFNLNTDLRCEIKDSDTEIVMPGRPLVVKRVGDEMDARVEERPNSKLCYHTMTEDPKADPPSLFTAPLKSDVYWSSQDVVIKGEGKRSTATQSQAAGRVPVAVWESSKLSKVICLTKWTSRGLMPVRPYIFTREKSFCLQALL